MMAESNERQLERANFKTMGCCVSFHIEPVQSDQKNEFILAS